MGDKDAATQRLKSKVENWVAGSIIPFRFNETRGPRNGRLVIDRVMLHATLNLTVATATTQGEDLARGFRDVTIREKDGSQRATSITGDALRIVSFAMNGSDRTHEHADFAASTANVNLTMDVPLSKRYAYEGGDYALAVELLDSIDVRCADATNMSLGTSVVTVNSGTYWVILECHEEMGIVHHVSDEWIVRPFASTSATELELLFPKGRLQDMYLYCPGQNGGQTLANLTEIFVEGLMPRSLLKDPDLSTFFQRRRADGQSGLSAKGAARTTSPFSGTTLRAVAALLTTGTKSYEGKESTKHLVRLVESGALPAAPQLICRIVKPRNPAVLAELMAKYNKKGWYVKAASKTRREPEKWNPAHLPYLPVKLF